MLVHMDIRDQFPTLLPGLREVKRRCPEVSWTPQQVYQDCVNSKAMLLMDESNPEAGFVIYYVDRSDLVLWIVYSSLPDAQGRYLSELVDLCRALRCTRLLMESPRCGFLRSPGWVPVTTTYALEVGSEQ